MTPRRTDKTWPRNIILALVSGVASGAVRAALAWLMDQLTSL